MTVKYDLHIHSALSPCGEERMTPNNIVNMALLAGLDIIAITDHNACGNCRAAIEAGKRVGLPVIAGMELTTSEEAHIVCLFPTADDAENFENEVKARQIKIQNEPEIFGHQYLMDADDNVIGEEKDLLIMATDISSDEVLNLCGRYNGAAIPAHIDKDSYSLMASLGFIDPEMGFGVCEVTDRCDTAEFTKQHPELLGVFFITNSDAHDLGPIGLCPKTLELDNADAESVVKFFAGMTGGKR